MDDREDTLELQVRVLADRLAISLLDNAMLMHAIVLLDGREQDRDLLREERGYLENQRAIRRMLTVELQRARLVA